jgi:hypothetical protein
MVLIPLVPFFIYYYLSDLTQARSKSDSLQNYLINYLIKKKKTIYACSSGTSDTKLFKKKAQVPKEFGAPKQYRK